METATANAQAMPPTTAMPPTAKPANQEEVQDPIASLNSQVELILAMLEKRGQNRTLAKEQEQLKVEALEKEAAADDAADKTRDETIRGMQEQINLLKQEVAGKQDRQGENEKARLDALWERMKNNTERLRKLAEAETAREKPFSAKPAKV